MQKATKHQILSGLRIGGSLGAFLIGGMLMGDGLGRILGAPGSHEVVWTDWIGWVELVLAAAILLLTARTWLMLLAGYLLFGCSEKPRLGRNRQLSHSRVLDQS